MDDYLNRVKTTFPVERRRKKERLELEYMHAINIIRDKTLRLASP